MVNAAAVCFFFIIMPLSLILYNNENHMRIQLYSVGSFHLHESAYFIDQHHRHLIDEISDILGVIIQVPSNDHERNALLARSRNVYKVY